MASILVMRISRWWRFKMWLSLKLLSLATWVINRRKAAIGDSVRPLTAEQLREFDRISMGRPLH